MAVLNPQKVEARFKAIEDRLTKLEGAQSPTAPPPPAPQAAAEADDAVNAGDDSGDEAEADDDDERPLDESRGKSKKSKRHATPGGYNSSKKRR